MKEIIVVGAGLSGAYIASNLANHGHKVSVFDRRSTIAGNIYDYKDKETNNIVHKYGPHIFHTDDDKIWEWVNKYTEWEQTEHRSRVYFKDTKKWHKMSFGFKLIEELYPKDEAIKLIHKIIDENHKLYYSNREYPHISIYELLNSKDPDIKKLANTLWENDFKPYTSKQWGIDPMDVDKNILRRIPFHLSYHQKLFHNKYEALPKYGYTDLIKNALNHENISVKLNTDPTKDIEFKNNKAFYKGEEVIVVFTGAIDELFNYEFGELSYRSLTFELFKNQLDGEFELGRPNVDIYPTITEDGEKAEFTRISNYGLFHYNNGENSKTHQISGKEYSHKFVRDTGLERYYPLSQPDDKKMYNKYKEKADEIEGLYLTGRLADYKYYDMDKAIIAADEKLKEIMEKLND